MGAGNFAVYTNFKAKDGVSPVFKNMSRGAGGFKDKMGGLDKAAGRFASVMKKSALVVTGLWAGMSGVIGVASKTTLDYAKEVRNMQRLTGASVEDASRMTAIGQRFGVSSDGMSKALRRLTIASQSGSKEFKSYGINVKDSQGHLLSAPKLLELVADKYKSLGGGLVGAAFAQKMMGRSAMEMVPILQQGSEGIREMYEQAERMGLVLSEKTMQSFIKYSKAQKDLNQSMKGIQILIGANVLPYFAKLGEKTQEFIQKFDFKKTGDMAKFAFHEIVTSLEKLKPVFDALGESFKYLSQHLIPELISLSPMLKFLFEGVFVPGLLLTINVFNGLLVAIYKTYNFIKSNLIPVMSILTGVLGGLALYKTIQFFQALRVQMALAGMEGGILGALAKGEIVTAMKALGVAVWGSVKAILAQNAALLTNPLFWIPAAIGSVIAVIVLLYKNWDFLTAVIGNWGVQATTWLTAFWMKAQEVFGAVGGFIRASFTGSLLSALAPISWIILGLKNIGGALENIKGGKLPTFGNQNSINPKTSAAPPLIKNNLTHRTSGSSGVIEVRNIVENRNNSRVSSSTNLIGGHHLTLSPAKV